MMQRTRFYMNLVGFFVGAAVLLSFLLFVTGAQAAWQVGGQLASGSLSGSPYQSSTLIASPVISDDGRYEFFVSRSSALSASAPYGGIFRKDLQNDSAPLDVVAAQPAGITVANCGIPNGVGASISVSANGRYVAFSTSQDGLVAGDSNGRRDVYVRDMNTAIGAGAFELASAADGSSSAPGYTLTDLGGGSAIPVPVGDNCLYGSELPGPNSLSNDGKKVIFTNTALTNISSPGGNTTGVGNIWARTIGTTNTELVTKVVTNYDSSPNATVGGPLPDAELYDADANNIARFTPMASISGDGSAVVWGGPFARYQAAYHRNEAGEVAVGDFQSFNYLYRRIADGAGAKTRRAISWSDLDDPNCDPNLAIDFKVDPDPGSSATYNKRLACIGPFSAEEINRNSVRVPALSDDGRKVFVLAGLAGHFLTEFINTYPLDVIYSDMTPGVSRKTGTKWITRGTNAQSVANQSISNFAVSGDGQRAVILSTRRDFSNTGLVQSGSFPATASTEAMFAINGTSGAVSGESGWSGGSVEWIARPTVGTTDPANSTFLPNMSLSRTGDVLAFGSKDPAFYSGANGVYQALCIKDSSTCATAPAASAPVVTIGGPPNGAVLGTQVGASYNAAGATSVTCQWDAEALLSPCPGPPLALKTLSAGAHTFSVTGTNASGSTTVTRNFAVGSPPAAATIITPTEGQALSAPVLPTYSVSGSPDTVRCWFDNLPWKVTNNTGNFNCPAAPSSALSPAQTLATGAHTFNVTTINAYGATTVTRNFTIGTPTSAVSITNPAEDGVYANTVSAAFSGTNSPTGFSCKIDAGSASACTSPLSLGVLSAGDHTLTITATNAGGTSTPVVRHFKIVTSAPTVTISSPANGATGVVSPVSPSFTLGGGAAATVTCQWDSEAVINNCTPEGIAGKTLAGGVHTLKVTATNPIGNDTKTNSFTVLSPPTVAISSPTENQVVAPAVTANFTLGGGATTTVTCQWDSEPAINSCTSPQGPKTLSAGAHTLTVTATNSAGSDSVTRNFSIPVGPTVTVTSPTEGQTLGSPLSASFTLGGGAATTVTCQWDSEPVINSCTSPQGPKTLTTGTHTFKVTATNLGGTASVTRNFTIAPVPTLSIDTPVASSTVASPVTASFTVSGQTSTTCQWDSETVITSCASPLAPKSLTPGAHTLSVSATNGSGTTTQSVAFTVLAPPTVTITAPTNGQSLESSATGSFTLGGGAASSVTCQWDSEPVTSACASPQGPKTLAVGAHTFTVTATNGSGTDAKTVNFTIAAPVTPPPPGEKPVPDPPAPSITPGKATVSAAAATIALNVTGSGAIKATASAKLPKGKKLVKQSAGSGSAKVSGDGTINLKFNLSAAAKKYLKAKGKLALSVTVTYTPTSGAPIAKVVKLTFKAKKK